MEHAPRLTVCVCTHNRPDYLASCLDGLARQTVPPGILEILVIDSASAPEAAAQVRDLAARLPNARVVRIEQPGLCLARNRAAALARAEYVGFLDDDAVPAENWAESALQAIADAGAPALIAGRILPLWEAPLPGWWPERLRGVLSIVEAEGQGEFGSPALPSGLEPCGANLIVHVPALKALGGFWTKGRCGQALLSDDEVQLAIRMQRAALPVWYDSRLLVQHRIQAQRLTPAWLLLRLHWQGISAVISRRLLGNARSIWWEFPRRLVLAAVLLPCWLIPSHSTTLIGVRWRLAYALGFIRAAVGLRLADLVS